jgi:hypothetical protein
MGQVSWQQGYFSRANSLLTWAAVSAKVAACGSLAADICRVHTVLTLCAFRSASSFSSAAVPAAWYHGPAAEKELAAATRVKGIDEPPHPSAYDAVAQPPEIHEYEEGECGHAGLSFPATAAAA